MKYIKKPIEVEAFHYGYDEIPLWFSEKGYPNFFNSGNYRSIKIDTLEGIETAYKGDMIVKGIIGEIYVCKKDIFDKFHDKIEDSKSFVYPVLTDEELKSL